LQCHKTHDNLFSKEPEKFYFPVALKNEMTKRVETAYLAETLFEEKLEQAIVKARDALLSLQHSEAYWCFELEADCTIPAEYILMMHYMDEVDETLQAKIARYLREHQGEDGGWPLFYGGKFDMSCSVKAYFALKLAGDSANAPHMVKAREVILAHGGAARSNVFTRMMLALFGQLPWRGVPFTPVEIILLPRWFPFHIRKVSYWSRTVTIPLSVLCSLKPRAKNPRRVDIRELFVTPPEQERNFFPVRSRVNYAFLQLDRLGRFLEPFIPRAIRQRALKEAERWFVERLNGTDGLGGIFPAMVNAHEALECLGYPAEHPYRLNTKEALKNLLVTKGDTVYCQPCVSPVWDTALSCMALQEEASDASKEHVMRALDWLKDRQLTDEPGDWQENHPELKGGGWAFQFSNSFYPDLDDTAVVALAMHQADQERYAESVRRATDWICGMQSKNGGFAAYDSDNTYYYLNEIPFADHGALLDPPTSDVSARCANILIRLGHRSREVGACLEFLMGEQEEDGSWFGRWGTNYIYGTWSVLAALENVKDPAYRSSIERGAKWLKSVQREDGGWGEDCDTYFFPERAGKGYASTSFQTAWAILGLISAGEVDSRAVRTGIEFLMRTQKNDGLWEDEWFTAPGFPRVFYLKYHGYAKYFPLWALTRYRNLRSKKSV
jgi:squalene-hopene/tetraprenyl-beta-curcumene cyclase